MTPITTQPYSIPAADYAREAIMTRLTSWWWVAALIIMGCGVGAWSDIRWAFVGLILIFLVVPFAIFNIYFSQLLTPESQKALAQKKIEIIPGEKIIITYTDPDTPLSSNCIEWHRITGVNSSKKYIRITLEGDNPPFLLISREAVTESDIAVIISEILK